MYGRRKAQRDTKTCRKLPGGSWTSKDVRRLKTALQEEVDRLPPTLGCDMAERRTSHGPDKCDSLGVELNHGHQQGTSGRKREPREPNTSSPPSHPTKHHHLQMWTNLKCNLRKISVGTLQSPSITLVLLRGWFTRWTAGWHTQIRQKTPTCVGLKWLSC